MEGQLVNLRLPVGGRHEQSVGAALLRGKKRLVWRAQMRRWQVEPFVVLCHTLERHYTIEPAVVPPVCGGGVPIGCLTLPPADDLISLSTFGGEGRSDLDKWISIRCMDHNIWAVIYLLMDWPGRFINHDPLTQIKELE